MVEVFPASRLLGCQVKQPGEGFPNRSATAGDPLVVWNSVLCEFLCASVGEKLRDFGRNGSSWGSSIEDL